MAGAMICVDQMKAFDSVDHGYIRKALQFFNFGDYFINSVCTIGMGRKACAMLENGDKTDIFELLKGTAHGDSPSPIINNIYVRKSYFSKSNYPMIYRPSMVILTSILSMILPSRFLGMKANVQQIKTKALLMIQPRLHFLHMRP
jgi:hypothetical protein